MSTDRLVKYIYNILGTAPVFPIQPLPLNYQGTTRRNTSSSHLYAVSNSLSLDSRSYRRWVQFLVDTHMD